MLAMALVILVLALATLPPVCLVLRSMPHRSYDAGSIIPLRSCFASASALG
jgi:hypothetical protein